MNILNLKQKQKNERKRYYETRSKSYEKDIGS